MRLMHRISLLGLLGVASAVLTVSAVAARTPTPTPTSTPPPAATPTPAAEQLSTFIGACWFDAGECPEAVTAKVNGVMCATDPRPVASTGGGRVIYKLAVPSREVVAGCGSEGSAVDFFVGDTKTNKSAIWHAGATESMAFIAGHPFADFSGGFEIDRRLSNEPLVAFVGDKECGRSAPVSPAIWVPVYSPRAGVGPAYAAGVIVYSNEQEPGCGVEGSQVTFKLLDLQGNVIGVANEGGVWHEWDGVSDPQQLNLTFGPSGGVTMPGTGTGEGSQEPSSLWGVVLMLMAVALAGIALGRALKKKTAAR